MHDSIKRRRDAAALIEQLALAPHPEGGHFRELYRSAMPVTIDDGRGPRTALTAIYFLLDEHEHSRLHRVTSDEIWQHVEGAPMELLLLPPTLDTMQSVTVGPLRDGHDAFTVVRAGWWQAARPVGGHSLCSCFVAPGFDFQDFSFLDDLRLQGEVREKFPEIGPLL